MVQHHFEVGYFYEAVDAGEVGNQGEVGDHSEDTNICEA